MVSIDTVYQAVLALANKEQRGYITPQEFNLFANKAQMDVFEQYFYDINQFGRATMPGNDTNYADMIDILEEKISFFEYSASAAYVYDNFHWVARYLTGGQPVPRTFIGLPDEVYRLGVVRVGGHPAELLSTKEFDLATLTPLGKPTLERPIMYRDSRGITIAYDVVNNTIQYANPKNSNISCTFIRKPKQVNWGYTIMNEKPLYDSTKSTNFELHESDESELVFKISQLVGITLNKPGFTQITQSQNQAKIQQEKI